MPRLKDKPIELDERKFIEWLLEVYYYRFMDQGVAAAKTPLTLSVTETARDEFLEQLRSQLTRFDLSFPLTKLPSLHAQALREISTHPTRPKPLVA